MTLDELRKRRIEISSASETTLANMNKIHVESFRAAEVAHNSRSIIENLEKEFEEQTGLNKHDIAFLFLATGLQCLRIYIINELTKVEKAGNNNHNEIKLHKIQKKILKKFDDGSSNSLKKYYAPLNQIITGRGVPYDATRFLGNSSRIFKGANHRFSTLGHDPIVGLVIGTVNILTNTITCVDKLPIIITNHVVYDADLKNPMIGIPANSFIAFKEGISRIDGDLKSVTAALIKQIIHIGTDLYTPCGIQIPFTNLLLDKKNVDKLTQYISTGDLVKIGTSFKIASFIDTIISTFHSLLYDSSKYYSYDTFNIKTRKIIDYSYLLATGSNVLINGIRISEGDARAIKDIDFAGLLFLITRLISDFEFQLRIKEEFILGGFNKLIKGNLLELQEVRIWD